MASVLMFMNSHRHLKLGLSLIGILIFLIQCKKEYINLDEASFPIQQSDTLEVINTLEDLEKMIVGNWKIDRYAKKEIWCDSSIRSNWSIKGDNICDVYAYCLDVDANCYFDENKTFVNTSVTKCITYQIACGYKLKNEKKGHWSITN
ncbi:MAG: hypothetical protein IH946_08635, partial [Bacteroidetes bacterium]|nr:hypothetical protein [Bacteroidota bacterium]